jgi:hypothetical protein
MSEVVRGNGRQAFLPFASAVAEYGLLLRDRGADVTRWRALASRVNALAAPASLAPDKQEFADLVDLARRLVETGYRR